MKKKQLVDEVLNSIELSEDVPEDVVTRFKDVRNLIQCARHNERLLRPALEYTAVTVELALRILCGRLGFANAMNGDGDQSLQNLIDWLWSHDYLPYLRAEEASDRPGVADEYDQLPEFYKALKRLRNSWLHTRDDNWLGWGFAHFISTSVEFVVNLYQEPENRREARLKRRCFNKHARRLSRQGCAIQTNDQRTLAHSVNILHCDVGGSPPTYYLGVWPLFNTDPNPGDELSDHIPYLAVGTKMNVTETGSLSLTLTDSANLTIDRDLSDKEREKLNSWLEKAGPARRRAFDMYAPAHLRAVLLNLSTPFGLTSNDLRWLNSGSSYPSDRVKELGDPQG